MPQTKSQKMVFAFITVILTVPLFVFYNLALEMGGMSNQVFKLSVNVIPVEFIFAIILSIFIAGPLAPKIAFSVVNPREEKPYIITTSMVCSTVILMCPMMSLVSAVLFHGVTSELLAQWMQNIVINFPFAFFTQLFLIQPIVRFIFRTIYKTQSNKKEEKYMQNNAV